MCDPQTYQARCITSSLIPNTIDSFTSITNCDNFFIHFWPNGFRMTRGCTLKNKGASRCHRRTFLSKWFHKESFNIWRTFLCHKSFFVVKEGSSDYKKVRKRCFFEWMVLCGTKNGSSMASLWRTFIFKSVSRWMQMITFGIMVKRGLYLLISLWIN